MYDGIWKDQLRGRYTTLYSEILLFAKYVCKNCLTIVLKNMFNN